MKFGDIICLSDDSTKKYIVLATKDIQEKKYALITEFNATFNVKAKTIKNADIDLKKAILISSNNLNNKVEFESNKEIIYELCNKFYSN